MKKSNSVITIGRIMPPMRATVVFALLLIGCGGTDRAADPAPDALYRAAIEDARVAEPEEIVTTLTPITPYNDRLVWRTVGDSTRQVRVVTWAGSDTLPGRTAGDTVTVKEDVWVTAVPDLRRFCRALALRGDRLRLRLAQRLGLPPDADYDRFVELWVRPSTLVRPCPDPEVTDRECEITFPSPKQHARVSEAHREWFRTLKQTSYGPDGYPFTGLGYTYDWNASTDAVGPSEFVIRAGAPVEVHSRTDTDAYCTPKE